MIALKIEDTKRFTAGLFVGEIFDGFLIREAVIVTFNSFTIDGHIRQGYYSEQEREENKIEVLSSWKSLKPFCFSLIKGKKLPGSFQITMQLAPAQVGAFLNDTGLSLKASEVNGLCLNIRYEEGSLCCVTGTSLNFFTLDKTVDLEWDEAVKRFFKRQEILFTAE